LGAFFSKPITGIGSGGFERQLEQLPQVFNVKSDHSDQYTRLSSHSTFLGVLAETGIVGMFAYLFWAYAVISIILSAVNNVVNHPFALGCVIMLAVFIVSDLWSQNSFLPNMSFMLGYVLGFMREREMVSESKDN
jgi:O-antigen ligase